MEPEATRRRLARHAKPLRPDERPRTDASANLPLVDMSELVPADVLRLQRSAGNSAVGRLLSRSTRLLQRHNMPMPKELKAPTITGQKAPWTVSGILKKEELQKLKQVLSALIPRDAKPSPDERVAGLAYIDCPTPDAMPKGYETVAAKVTEKGEIFFNNSLEDYYNEDGSPNADKIKTTVVHESMHAVSANHTGLQEYAGLMSKTGDLTTPQHQADEAVTDFLSVQVYEQVFGTTTPYVTAYWVPASSNVAAAEPAKKALAQNQQLPVGWTGQMVDVLQGVLNVDEDQLKDMYFKDPAAFGTAIKGKEQEIRDQWNLLLGRETLEKQDVLSAEFKDPALTDVVKEKLPELHREPDEKAQIAIVKAALTAKKIATTTPGGKAAVFSDAVIKKKIAEVLKPLAGALPPELQGVKQVDETLVNGLIQQHKEAALHALQRSELFPLSAWTSPAWSIFQNWIAAT